ncbi:uncharacterized protein PGTG_09822 [Puccinia graminis f. sp. tritici CRL 75-36-700-3]|uniref:DDE Tnp4 domain-containing protein n=1 Tax=Puccinia graminis f. sp. tritici (strain CRL 75-36-700-3 / race SCCL) TaxID=418459 RepID=E3KF23_PUCGT|nr:uncharacterized protein PGTG_09822 [Puccinia graminis f. sp. tritici CRL 75-36-700-3]EFP82854.1 hypothetical protein PGTG_09822 [Puccinia graminis f. sp. tritici CRL 75-36-700-3]
MKVHLELNRFFDSGQYLIADSAYGLSMTTIPAYKSPLSKITRNTKFNYCLAKSRVRNEHTIGILKGRWASLQQLCLSLYTPQHMLEIIRWINCCVALHNMLAHLGDSWDDLAVSNDNDGPVGPQVNDEDDDTGHCEEIQNKCLIFNHLNGTLPIPSN